jgi:sulfate adenylyltransferase
VIRPYGAARLVDRYLPESAADDLVRLERAGATAVTCDAEAVLECSRIADGSLTPLEGFLDAEETDAVVRRGTLRDGRYFPLPILLQAPGLDPARASREILLRTDAGRAFGYLTGASAFRYDLERLCRATFGVWDPKHPGVLRLQQGGDVFVGGALRMLPQADPLGAWCLSPAATRAELERRGWRTCAGFQTRNVPHLAHEYLQRIALETTDGLLIHPVVGWKKADDYRPEVVLGAYRYLVEEVYPAGKVLLSGLQIQMRYAGPKEAVLHAIIRQNFGCTHFIVGRDHAGVGGFYGKYDAHRIFDTVGEHLDVRIMRLMGPFYCDRCRSIVTENTCGHDGPARREVSGSLIREMILQGRYPPEEFIRRGVVDVIKRFDEIFIDA